MKKSTKLELGCILGGALMACMIGGVLYLGTSDALAADNLPVNGQKGFAVGLEAGTTAKHITIGKGDETYRVKSPSVGARVAYGNERFEIGGSASAVRSETEDTFSDHGASKYDAPAIGADAKLTVVKLETFKLGIIGGVGYLFKGDVTKTRPYVTGGATYNLYERIEFGKVLTASGGIVAQWQPAEHFVFYAGEKYEDIIHADIDTYAKLSRGSWSAEGADQYKVKQVKNFSTIAGIIIPLGSCNIIAQGRYMPHEPVGGKVASSTGFSSLEGLYKGRLRPPHFF